ncbi:hypothetical protein XENOCAPTIV_011331 [Xenoophorus captivus]|uniref:Growth factor receptor domain-containing protein n=1 Tax=Xenoophorus captivus TaxID=1517983 RepID=A0ABV0R8I7_9TELE
MSCDEHECYWCETDLFLSEGNCVSVCPDGFYGNEDFNECEECHPDCEVCTGPENTDCLSCEEGRTLANKECVPNRKVCPIKTFLNDYGVCEACHPSCKFCSGRDKNQCTKCGEGRFLTMQQTCVARCPAGFFASRLSSVCEACPQGCLQCVDARHCSRCQSSRKAPLFLQNGQCVTECVRSRLCQLCLSCAVGCASCEKNATHCLTCNEPLLLHDHQCVQECPPAHIVQDKECHHCPPACQDCNLLGQCTGCEEYHFLHEGLCVPDCPKKFFENNERGECLRCHADCAFCDGPNSNDCNACVHPEAILLNGACLGHLLLGESSLVCVNSQKYVLLMVLENFVCMFVCVGADGACVDECPAGYYKEESKCEQCHTSCQSCVGKQSHQCLTCEAHLFREAKECVETCQHG